MKGFFVTGTDTGVGKTFVTVAVARHLRAKGHQVFAFKPIETGCDPGRPLGPDQTALCEAAGNWQLGPLRGLYQFRSPTAPLVAALAEARSVDLDLVELTMLEGAARSDVTLVEGAGGWRVPLTESADIGSLAKRLQLPVILVGRAKLGTINHVLLSLEAIEKDGCLIAAVVLSRMPEDDLELTTSNVEQIRLRWPGRIIVLDRDPGVLDILDGLSEGVPRGT